MNFVQSFIYLLPDAHGFGSFEESTWLAGHCYWQRGHGIEIRRTGSQVSNTTVYICTVCISSYDLSSHPIPIPTHRADSRYTQE